MKEDEDYCELRRVKTDGTDDTLLCQVYDDGYTVDFIAASGDTVYYSHMFDGITSYNISDGSLSWPVDGRVDDPHMIGGKIFYVAMEDDEYIDGTLMCFDPDTGSAEAAYDKEISTTCIDTVGGDMYLIPEPYTETRTGDIFRIDPDTAKAEKVCTLETDDRLCFLGVRGGVAFYQNYSEEKGRFQTFSTTLSDGKTTQYDEIDYSLSMDTRIPDSACFSGANSVLDYDFDTAAFRKMVPSADVKGTPSYYYDGHCYYYNYDETEKDDVSVEITAYSLSSELPDDSMKYSGEPSSPDNEHLRLKRVYYNINGGIYHIPELTLDSDDAKKVNEELDSIAPIMFGCYYKSFLNGDYLTVYTLEMGESGYRNYRLYTFDVKTGKRLSDDEIIALAADDRADFDAQLTEMLKKEQRALFENINIDPPFSEEKFKELDEYVESDRMTESAQYGYLGGSKIIVVVSLLQPAGAGSGSHYYEFEYKP